MSLNYQVEPVNIWLFCYYDLERSQSGMLEPKLPPTTVRIWSSNTAFTGIILVVRTEFGIGGKNRI